MFSQIRLVMAVSAAIAAGASFAGNSAAAKTEQLEGGYSIEVPMTLHLAQGNPMPDFALYKLTDQKGKQLLLIYLGSAPDTRFEPPRGAVSSSTSIDGCAATSVRWSGKGGTLNGATLIHLTGDHWPRFAHLIFQGLSKGDSEIAEGIVSSFRRDQAPK
jgi:hypothetical protein